MEIKVAAEKDIPDILRLWMEFMYFNSEAEPFGDRNKDVLGEMVDHFKKKITAPNNIFIIAVEEGRTIGYAFADITKSPETHEKIGKIYDVTVTQGFRKQGIGQKMLETIKAWFIEHKIETIELTKIMKKRLPESFWAREGIK